MIAAAETKVALRARRLFAFNVLVPAALVGPIAFSTAPRVHAVVVYAVLFTFFGVFGSAIPLVRDATTGLLARLTMTGMAPHRLLLERLAANALLDSVQLVPALALVAIAARAGMGDVLFAFAALVLTLVLANAIGQWVAAFAGSIAEAALFAAVVALVSLHVSGLFRTPAPGSLWTWIETFSPFSALHDALAAMTHIATAPAGARHALGLAGAATGVMLVIGVTAAAAPLLASRLERAVYAHD